MKNLSILACLLLLVACSQDKDFDLDSIDSTVGINLDNLTIPESSTSKIYLHEILELKDSKTIVYDNDSNYVFEQDGGDVKPEHPFIDAFTVAKRSTTGHELEIKIPTLSPSPKMKAPTTLTLKGEEKIQLFTYDGTIPKEVEKIDKLNTFTSIKLALKFPKELADIVPYAGNINFHLPEFMTLSNLKATTNSYTREGNTVKFTNVPTNTDLVITADITELDLNKTATSYGFLEQKNGMVKMEGEIFAEFSATPNIADLDITKVMLLQGKTLALKSDMGMSDFVITGASGRFAPDMKLTTIGSAKLNDVPDFLTKEGVVVDLDNIKLFVDINNDMQIGGFVSGTLKAIKNNKEIKEVNVQKFKINPAGTTKDNTTKVCICRKTDNSIPSDYTPVVVPDLTEIIKTIPDEINFDVNIEADNNMTASIQLGKEYTIKPSYKVQANIAFGEEAQIIYDKVFDGWNDDMKDIGLKSGSTVKVTTNAISTIPLNMKLVAVPIDKNGNEMKDVTVDTKEVFLPASTDGKTPSKALLALTITDSADNALKNLDGIKITLTGSSKAEGGNTATGVTLNGKTQYIEFDNIKITLNGKIIYDDDK